MRLYCVLTIVLILPGLAAPRRVSKRVTASDQWCAAINSLRPGDELVFATGDYRQPCSIRVSGTPESPIIIRSESEQNRSRLTYDGSTSNVLEVYGSYLTIRGFTFLPNSEDVLSLRIMGDVRHVTVERNLFSGFGNVAVSANSGSTADLLIRENEFKNLESTAVYIGCHDGNCRSTNLLFERNFIDGVRAADPNSIGYGIEVKLNSWGVIRDNTIVNTKGPPIMAYGSQRTDSTLIEGNYVEGSRTEAGIVLGGGPAIVRNNISVGNANGGISSQNYGRRNLQRNIWIVHNTVVNNGDSGIFAQQWPPSGNNVIAYNAVLPRLLTPPIVPAMTEAIVLGNVICNAACFVNAVKPPYDFWPSEKSPLVGVAPRTEAAWKTLDDFMGEPRDAQPDAGALERSRSSRDHRVSRQNLRPPRAGSASY